MPSLTFKSQEKPALFHSLCGTVANCRLCNRMNDSLRVLNYSSGSLDAEIMFIGEAPGRHGADSSGVPFHGDKSGHNFEDFLDFAGINRSSIFVTNSVLCNPKDVINGNNATPDKTEVLNCNSYLKSQIEIINPKIVVTLGQTALDAVNSIESHGFKLRDSVRTKINWFNRILVPFYHPGQRALLHRSLANQRSDYQFLAELVKRGDKTYSKSFTATKLEVAKIVELVVLALPSINYFTLHKLFYLIEYNFYEYKNERLTDAYIIRQKDGPYITDLHIFKLKRAIPNLHTTGSGPSLRLNIQRNLFSDNYLENSFSDGNYIPIVEKVINKYGNLSPSRLKTAVYLTRPMRNILLKEKEEGFNLYNAPVIFESSSISTFQGKI